MTPNTFWTFFLKAFGLYLIWQTLTILPSFFSTLIYIGRSSDKSDLFPTLAAIVFLILFFIAVLRYCIFKTDRIIEKLHLTKSFADEKIDVNIHRSSLLSIVTIVLGGLMLADGLPLLILNIFEYLKYTDTATRFIDNRYAPYLISNLIKIVIGYFMVADSRLIVNFIERKRAKTSTNNDPE